MAMNLSLQEKARLDLADFTAQRMDNLAYEAMAGTTTVTTPFHEDMLKTGPIELGPSIKEQDFDCLRDFLVDMCSATLPESPPSQEEWNEIRERAKAAAVEHSMYNRDEKKAVKKPGGRASIGLNTTTASMHSGTQFQGRSADLLIIDDIGANNGQFEKC